MIYVKNRLGALVVRGDGTGVDGLCPDGGVGRGARLGDYLAR